MNLEQKPPLRALLLVAAIVLQTAASKSGEVMIERDGAFGTFRAVAAPEMATLINDLMLKKYGWREQVISTMFGSRDGSLPLRIEQMVSAGESGH